MGGNVLVKMTLVAATEAVRAQAERVGNKIAFTEALEGWAKAPMSKRSGCRTLNCSTYLPVNFQTSMSISFFSSCHHF